MRRKTCMCAHLSHHRFVWVIVLVIYILYIVIVPQTSQSGTKALSSVSKNKATKKEFLMMNNSNLDSFAKNKSVFNLNYLKPNFQLRPVNTGMKVEVKHTILWWNAPKWIKVLARNSDMANCLGYCNCLFSYDKSNFNQSDAVIYSISDVGFGKRPPVKWSDRNFNQIWIFFTLESPANVRSRNKLISWRNVFNWSLSYRTDADIFFPYGSLEPKQKTTDKDYSGIFHAKTKFAAWVVSDCETQSKRELYAEILQKYIEVDIYGKCGQGSIKDDNSLGDLIGKNYKFYLSFENSLCNDYITEKFFRYYQMDVVTVFRGISNSVLDFANDSFIDSSAFPSVSSLTNFLKYLARNEELYIQYLRNRDNYYVYREEVTLHNSLCNICHKLNNLSENKRMYSDAYKWLGQCTNAIDLDEH